MGNDLGPPVRDHILRKTRNPEDMVNDHLGHLLSRVKFGKRDKVNHLRKMIHHCKDNSIAT